MTIRASRLVAAGALAAAAVAAPIAIALTSPDATGTTAQCRAHFGNIEDNVCLDGPDNGQTFNIGTPDIGVYGPNAGNTGGGGIGLTTGGLLPGTTWTSPIR